MKNTGRKSFHKGQPKKKHLTSVKGQTSREKHLKIAPKHPGKGRS